METPSNDRHSANIISSLTSSAINGKEDSQDWPTDVVKRATLSTIREANRLLRSGPSEDETPVEGVCEDTTDQKAVESQPLLEDDAECPQFPVGSNGSIVWTLTQVWQC